MRILFFGLCIFVLGLQPLHSATSRVAVLNAAEALRPAADLLTAGLSKQPGIVVLERAELDRIAKERSLSITNVLAAAKILGADALLFLETAGSSTNQAAVLRLVAVKPGVILYSSRIPWPPDDLSEWAATISVKIAQNVLKSATPSDQAVKISILNLRSVVNSTAQQLLERELTSLLISRLAHEPNLFVLERRQLTAAVFEKDLAASEEKFWTGSHLLDGTINRDRFDPKRVTISARLRAPDGTDQQIESEGPRDDLNNVIEELVAKILSALKVEKRADWDPAREAAQHLAEANWAVRWKMWKEAQAAADSAWALGEKSIDATSTRLLAYTRDTNAPTSLESLHQAMALVRETLSNNESATANAPWWSAARETLENSGQLLAQFHSANRDDEKLADVRSLGRSVIESLLNDSIIRRDFWSGAEYPEQDPIAYFKKGDDFFSILARRSPLFYERPEDTAALFKMLITGEAFPWIRREFTAHNRPLLGGWKPADRQREPAAWQAFLNELRAATNALTQLEAPLLALVVIPAAPNNFEPGSRFKSPQGIALRNELATLIAKNRDAILTANVARNPRTISHYGGGISRSKDPIDELNSIEQERFDKSTKWDATAARAKLDSLQVPDKQSEMIAHAKRLFSDKKSHRFQELAPLTQLINIPRADALELLPLLKSYRKEFLETEDTPESKEDFGFDFDKRQSVITVWMLERQLNAAAGLPQSTDPSPLPMTSGAGHASTRNEDSPAKISVAPLVKLTRFWKLPNPTPPNVGVPHLSAPILRDGSVWFRAFDGGSSNPHGGRIFRMDAESLAVEQVIPLSENQFQIRTPFADHKTHRSFEAFGKTLFVMGADGLFRLAPDSTTWQKIPLPATDGQPWRVGANFYFLTPHTLFLLDPATGVARTLASIRRRPALGPLDELDTLAKIELTAGPGGTLRAFHRATCYRFDGTTFTEELTLPQTQWSVTDDGAFSVISDLFKPQSLQSLPASATTPAPVPNAHGRYVVGAGVDQNNPMATTTPRYGLHFMLSNHVAILCGHDGSPRRLTFASNARWLDLFLFGPAGETPVQIPMELDLAQGPAPGYDPHGGSGSPFTPWLQVTPQHILLGHTQCPGVWIIPLNDLNTAGQAHPRQQAEAQNGQ